MGRAPIGSYVPESSSDSARRSARFSFLERPRELLELLGLARLREDLGPRRAELLLIRRAQTSPFVAHFATSWNHRLAQARRPAKGSTSRAGRSFMTRPSGLRLYVGPADCALG